MRLFWKILGVFGIIAAGVALVVLIKLNDQEQVDKAQLLTDIENEARPIRVRMNKLESEIAEMEKKVPVDVPGIVDAFILHSVEDLKQVDEWVDWHSFYPSILFEVPMQEDCTEILVLLKERNYEIILTADEWNDAIEENIDNAKEVLDQYDLKCDVFMLQKKLDKPTNRRLLMRKGFTGLLVQNDDFTAGVSGEGMAYLPYFYGESKEIVKEYGEILRNNRSAGACIFDFSWTDSETLYDYVDAMDDSVYYYNARYLSLRDALQEQIDIANLTIENQRKECEAYIEERRTELIELQAELDRIYGQWSE